MSSLPPPEEVAGPYLPQYDVYYKKLDVDGKGEIGAMEAATFLKKIWPFRRNAWKDLGYV
jgi:hypothetical protein